MSIDASVPAGTIQRLVYASPGDPNYLNGKTTTLVDQLRALSGSGNVGSALCGQGDQTAPHWFWTPQVHVLSLSGLPSTSGGGIASWTWGTTYNALITRVIFNLQIPSTGAANISIGVAANTGTSSANLMDTFNAQSSAGLYDNITNGGAGGSTMQIMTNTQSLTITGSADTTGLVGSLYIQFFRM